MYKIVCISDTHNKHEKITIPKCDILISAGDYSGCGSAREVENFHNWMNRQPATYKISVQGNHELWVEKNFEAAKVIAERECPGVIFIHRGLIEICGIKIYCDSITPFFRDWAWNAFIDELKAAWAAIPDDTNILVTHGPAYGILDTVGPWATQHLGCAALLNEIQNRVLPKYHICGHIHGGHGRAIAGMTTHMNVSICTEEYAPLNPVTEFIYEY